MFDKLKSVVIKKTCPYCFDQFLFKHAPYQCTHEDSCPGAEADSVLVKHWPELAAGKQGKILDPGNAKFGKLVCDSCERIAYDRICPNCHVKLPPSFDASENAIIAVIGGVDSGKSNYIATLVNEIYEHVSISINVTLMAANDYTSKRYQEKFKEPLYGRHTTVIKTDSAKTSSDTGTPLIFILQFHGKDKLGREGIRKTISLVFFDAAGEDLNEEATMATENRYICSAAGIILLVDPRQIPYVKSKLNVEVNEIQVDARSILARMVNIIRKGRGLGANALIKTPIAIALSKFDEVEAIVDPSANVLQSRSDMGYYDVAESIAISDEVETLLVSWQQQGMCHELKSWFKKVKYFGVSALGCQATGKGVNKTIPHSPRPKRVEDPFLWILHELNYLKSARGDE